MFVNNKIEVKRLETSGDFQIYNTVLTNLECMLQNIDEGILGQNLDGINQSFLITIIGGDTILNGGEEFVFNEKLIRLNDVILDKNENEYLVNSVKFFEGPIYNSLEIYVNYKKND